jgi:hypothetical protein
MSFIYTVIENGVKHTNLYDSYESARKAVTTKYAKQLRDEWEDAQEMNDPDIQLASIIVDENPIGATTKLYINTGNINITINKVATA